MSVIQMDFQQIQLIPPQATQNYQRRDPRQLTGPVSLLNSRLFNQSSSNHSESQVEADFRRDNSHNSVVESGTDDGFFNGGPNPDPSIVQSEFASQPLAYQQDDDTNLILYDKAQSDYTDGLQSEQNNQAYSPQTTVKESRYKRQSNLQGLNQNSPHEFLLNLKQDLHALQLQKQQLDESLEQANQKLDHEISQKEVLEQQLQNAQKKTVEDQRIIWQLKNCIQLIVFNLEQLKKDPAFQQNESINDCLEKSSIIKTIQVAQFEILNQDHSQDINTLIAQIQAQLQQQTQLINSSPSQMSIGGTLQSNLRKINSSSSRAIGGIGSRSRQKIDQFLNIVVQRESVKEILHDVVCDVEADDEHVITYAASQTLERSATFAALRPDIENLVKDFCCLSELVKSQLLDSQSKAVVANDQCVLLNKQIVELTLQKTDLLQQLKQLKSENSLLQQDCGLLILTKNEIKEKLNQEQFLNQQSNKLIESLRANLKENQEKLRTMRLDYQKLSTEQNQQQVLQAEVKEKETLRQLTILEVQLQTGKDEYAKLSAQTKRLNSKLDFEVKDASFKQSQLQEKIIELQEFNKSLIDKYKQTVEQNEKSQIKQLQEEVSSLSQQTTMLRVQVKKEKDARLLYEELKSWSETGQEPRASFMMEFVHYLLGKRDSFSGEKQLKIQEVIQESKLIFEYETKLSEMTQLSAKLIAQIKEFLTEKMALARKNQENEMLETLKEQDRVLSQYQLEQECRQSVFDWIRDIKDFEIREELKNQIKGLNSQIKLRDSEIIYLQQRLDDILIMDKRSNRIKVRDHEMRSPVYSFGDKLDSQRDGNIADYDIEKQKQIRNRELQASQNEQQIFSDEMTEQCHLQMINCQATLIEELLRSKRSTK